MQCEKKSVRLLGTELYYESYGEGLPLLILHGWSVDHQLMSGPMELFFEKNSYKIKRIYIDLPGMGKSKASSHIKTSDDMLQVLLAFVDEILPAQPFLLAGESYGGALCRAMLQKRANSIAGLFLLCPVVCSDQAQRTVPTLIVLEKDTELLEGLSVAERGYFEYMTVRQTHIVWERYKRDILDALKNQDSYFLNHVLDGAFSYDIDTLEMPFEKPALILTGRQDSEVGYQEQFKLLTDYPRATFAVLDKAGHNLQIEQYELFCSLFCEWLDRALAEW